jgi:hypothetical protein
MPDNQPIDVKKELLQLPTWAKLVLAIGSLVIFIKFFPILDLIQLFLYVVIIPLGFFTAIGVISSEAANSFTETCREVSNKLREAAANAQQQASPPSEEN